MGIGQRRDQGGRGEELENEQQIFSQQAAEPLPHLPLFQHALPEEERGRSDLKPFGTQAVENENRRDGAQQKQQSGRSAPTHRLAPNKS
jgi:hypothetical protein